MVAQQEEVDSVPQIRNITDIPNEPELITHVHFTGEQWQESIRNMQEVTRPDPIDGLPDGGLRYRRLPGSRGDVLVTPRGPSCFGRGSGNEVCFPVVNGSGPAPRLKYECRCFPRGEKEEDRSGSRGSLEEPCELAYDLEEWKWVCQSPDCENCVELIQARSYRTGIVSCACLEINQEEGVPGKPDGP